MSKVVLDASAVLASFLQEAGGESVMDLLPGALLSAVNYTEMLTLLLDRGVPGRELTQAAADIAEIVVPFDAEQAHLAAMLRAATRRLAFLHTVRTERFEEVVAVRAIVPTLQAAEQLRSLR